MHPRSRLFGPERRPQIVSKYFGLEGSFVLDAEARFIPSTGHVWTSKREFDAADFTTVAADDEEIDIADDVRMAASFDVLRAYVALLNSRVFIELASFRSVTIAGGQLDLTNRFLGPVYLPDLWASALNPVVGGYVRRLAAITAATARGEEINESDRDHLVARLYGVPELAEA